MQRTIDGPPLLQPPRSHLLKMLLHQNQFLVGIHAERQGRTHLDAFICKACCIISFAAEINCDAA